MSFESLDCVVDVLALTRFTDSQRLPQLVGVALYLRLDTLRLVVHLPLDGLEVLQQVRLALLPYSS